MNTRYLFTPESPCNSAVAVSLSSISAVGEERAVTAVTQINRSARVISPPSFLMRMAMRISRARWYSFIRRVFHYQNGSRSDLGSNPFNSGAWMVMELVALVFQVVMIVYTLVVSKDERPVWPMRIWVSGYGLGSVLNLVLLFWRYRVFHSTQGDGSIRSDVQHYRNNEESRNLQLLNKWRSLMELLFAIWFVMGNVWVFDSQFGSFRRSPKLYVLCISLLAWNAISYSFPFILFVLLCCCVPLISSLLGYNMNVGSVERGASNEQLSNLSSWRYKEVAHDVETGKSVLDNENSECCICLAKYRDNEEIRQLPCSHIFHLKCVDQWLRIVSCCPLCKQELER